jgi:hypothetical protein
MPLTDREAVIKFVEHTYFGSVQRQDIAAVMDCFTATATVIIRHGDNPVRQFSKVTQAGTDNLQDFYAHLCGNYDAWFGDFQHYIDGGAQRSACYFTVQLTPKPDGLYAAAGRQTLQNCNFFDYKGDRIRHMIIYYSNTGSADGTPTGYPQQAAPAREGA